MLNTDIDETDGVAERELSAMIAATLPRNACVRTLHTNCGGYDIEAEWRTSSPFCPRANYTLALHFTSAEISNYSGFSPAKRENVCRRVADWLSIRLELQAGESLRGKGFNMDAVAPWAFFIEDATRTTLLQ